MYLLLLPTVDCCLSLRAILPNGYHCFFCHHWLIVCFYAFVLVGWLFPLLLPPDDCCLLDICISLWLLSPLTALSPALRHCFDSANCCCCCLWWLVKLLPAAITVCNNWALFCPRQLQLFFVAVSWWLQLLLPPIDCFLNYVWLLWLLSPLTAL